MLDLIAGRLDLALLFLAVVILLVEALAALRAWHIRSRIPRGEPGHALLTIIAGVITMVVIKQAILVVGVAAILVDRHGLVDFRIVLGLAAEVVMTAAVVWGSWKVERLWRS